MRPKRPEKVSTRRLEKVKKEIIRQLTEKILNKIIRQLLLIYYLYHTIQKQKSLHKKENITASVKIK